jgi:NAD kinase
LSLDGQISIPLLDQDEVTVRASKHTVTFVRLQEQDYFYRNLTSKMKANLES